MILTKLKGLSPDINSLIPYKEIVDKKSVAYM